MPLEELEDSLSNRFNLINMANHIHTKINATVWHFNKTIRHNVNPENQFQTVFKMINAIGDP